MFIVLKLYPGELVCDVAKITMSLFNFYFDHFSNRPI